MTNRPFIIDDSVCTDENIHFDTDAIRGGRQHLSVERVSIASDGTQATGESLHPTISANGRYVTYGSFASTLVPDDTNGAYDIFIYDRKTNTIERISVASDGTEANGSSYDPEISANGRYVTYTSEASNLVPDDTNPRENGTDIFVYDRKTNTTERINVASDGTQANDRSFSPEISAKGRYVTYTSDASNLVPDDTNNAWDIFVYDRKTNTTERINMASDGTEANSFSSNPAISANGRYVTYESQASNLVPDDTNDTQDIFVYDRKTNTTERISVASNCTEANSGSFDPEISANGRYVTYTSEASNLVPDDTNNAWDIFVYDRKTNTTERVSVASDGTQANERSFSPAISDNGRHVTYGSFASNLVPDDTNGTDRFSGSDVFVFDRKTNTTERVSVAPDGTQANDRSFSPAISANGHHVTYASSASNLVPDDTNNTDDETGVDIFVASRWDWWV
ncbi:TolB family protein [Microvirga sp. P5_D2]